MKIFHIRINNFRGIRELDWVVPDQKIFCLIGRGDSTKSTILESLRRAFHPQWNLSFDDSDFYGCSCENTICIEVTLGDISDEFRDLARYGYMLSGWNTELGELDNDPGEGLEEALRVRLVVSKDLEPKWTVIKSDGDEGIPFRSIDRARVSVNYIGVFSDRHLTWAKGSILSQLTTKDDITTSLSDAGRAAKSSLEGNRAEHLLRFDEVAVKAEVTAKSLGVNVENSYKAHLDSEVINIKIGGLSLHDGEMPLRRLGLGSKRMLTTGLQKQALQTSHITLFDEVEIGLEPHRISRLLNHLEKDETGQYFLTTHSPAVIRELNVNQLHVVHSNGGVTEIIGVDMGEVIQGKIRSGAEAFLAPKIIVCEGATEIGFLRGLDIHWWENQDKHSLAYQGVALFDAHGASKIRASAEAIKNLKYDVAVFADSDERTQFSLQDEAVLGGLDVAVITWAGTSSIEERVFADLPWLGVAASYELVRLRLADDGKFLSQVESQFQGDGFNRVYGDWEDIPQLRTALGKAAKSSEWFKRIDRAQEWARAISGSLGDDAVQGSDLFRKLAALREWVDHV